MMDFWLYNRFNLSSNLIHFAIGVVCKSEASFKVRVAVFYVLVVLSLNNFLYSVGETSNMFFVLSAGINKLSEALTFTISAFIKFWNLLFMFLNLMDFIISNRSFSNVSQGL